MKTPHLVSLLALAALLLGAAAKPAAGPKGGRLLSVPPLLAEVFVTQDRRLEVTFYDASRQPVAPGERVVAVTAEPKTGRTPVELTRTGHGFASVAPLPAADEPYRLVVQIRERPDARPQNFRVDLNLAPCGECNLAEYACTCTH